MRSLLALAAVVAVGCGPTPLRPAPESVPPSRREAEDRIVAFMDETPIHWRDVVRHAYQTHRKLLIDQYIAWKLRDNRARDLGLRNTPEELEARARAHVQMIRRLQGEETIRRQLSESRLTEEAYVEHLAARTDFSDRLISEKLFFHTVLAEASIEIDTFAFADENDARAFAELASRHSFDEAQEHLRRSTDRGPSAQWPRYRFSRGLAPDAIADAPGLEERLLEMKAGETTGVQKTASHLAIVIHVVNVHPPSSASGSELGKRVLAEVLRQPPSDAQLGRWMQRLFKGRTIRYEDRDTQGN
ncbi:MAG: hypothetical protein HY716_00340 [Planctomycetes bacterium]|nr:hypothetical protein [Planctomycetota bacterium]